MLSKLKEFFTQELDTKNDEGDEQKLRQACAALLFEVSKADFDQSEAETNKVKSLLQDSFDMSDMQLNELIKHTEKRSDDTTSVYPFTSLIKEHYDYAQRVELINLMWKVAYADGTIDRYEDDLIRKVADLLYVRHSDFIQAKLSQSENE